MVIEKDPQADLEKILRKLVKDFKIPVSRLTLKRTVNRLPDHPSLADVTDILEDWKIASMAVKLQRDDLWQINLPSIAVLKQNEYIYYVLITHLKQNEITYFDPGQGYVKESIDRFAEKWDGIVVLFEIDDDSGEDNYKVTRRESRLEFGGVVIGISSLSIVALMGFYMAGSIHISILLFLKFAGLYLSFVLMQEVIGITSPLLRKICGSGAKTSCISVLHSPVAKLFGIISMADIGIVYFAGGSLAILFSAFNLSIENDIVQLLSILNILALPYTVFSIYYQGFVVKKWCPLCLGVQLILWLEFFASFFWSQVSFSGAFHSSNILLFTLSFLLPLAALSLIKPYLSKSRSIPIVEKELRLFKEDTDVFFALLKKQKYSEIGQLGNDIVMGNMNANVTLTIVSNPTCVPCAEAHQEIKKMVARYGADFKVIVRFLIKNDEASDGNKVINLLAAMSARGENTEEALDDWYTFRSYKKWSEKYAVHHHVSPDLADLKNWLKYANVDFTPYFFINGRSLPKYYTVYDLKHHLSNLNKLL